MREKNILTIAKEDLDRIKEIFSLFSCKLNCEHECLKNLISLFQKNSGFGILRPLMTEKNCERFLFEILKEPFSYSQQEIISEMKKAFPSKFHCSTLTHKILEVQRIVIERPEENKSIRDLAFEVALNPSYLSFKFKELTGVSLKEFVRKIKLCKSLWEVISNDEPIKLIARKYGYTYEAFTRIFHSAFGLSPNSVRKRFHDIQK